MVAGTSQMRRFRALPNILCLLILLVLIGLIAVSGVHAGELYRWMDKDGRVHVTDTPPDPSACKDVKSIRTPDVKGTHAAEAMVPQNPQIAIYGRDRCGFTRQMKSVLNRENIPYRYEIIDNKSVSAALEKRMRSSGIETKSYNLPVVEMDGRIFVRPNPADVVDLYQYSR